MSPTIAVLVPVRGQAAFLSQAIESLLAQEFDDWSATLIATNEAVLEAVEAASLRDKRIRVTQAVGGEVEALAAAASEIDSAFVCVLDGDDTLEPQALSLLFQALQANPEAGMAYSRHVVTDAGGRIAGTGPLCELPYSADALLLDFMTGPLRLIRATTYRDAGGFDAASLDAADYDLCLRLSETTSIIHVPQALYRRRIHPAAPELTRWDRGIEARYQAFVRAVRRRGLDADYDCALEIDSWHILQPASQPFGGLGILR